MTIELTSGGDAGLGIDELVGCGSAHRRARRGRGTGPGAGRRSRRCRGGAGRCGPSRERRSRSSAAARSARDPADLGGGSPSSATVSQTRPALVARSFTSASSLPTRSTLGVVELGDDLGIAVVAAVWRNGEMGDGDDQQRSVERAAPARSPRGSRLLRTVSRRLQAGWVSWLLLRSLCTTSVRRPGGQSNRGARWSSARNLPQPRGG